MGFWHDSSSTETLYFLNSARPRKKPWTGARKKFAFEASLLGQILVLRTSEFRGAAIGPYFLERNTLLFKLLTMALPIKIESE